MSSNTVLKVWVTGDFDGSLRVLPARGLKVYAGRGRQLLRADGLDVQVLADQPSGSGYKLSYRKANGSYVTKSTGLSNNTWKFSNSAKIVRVDVCPTVRSGRTGARSRWSSGAAAAERSTG